MIILLCFSASGDQKDDGIEKYMHGKTSATGGVCYSKYLI